MSISGCEAVPLLTRSGPFWPHCEWGMEVKLLGSSRPVAEGSHLHDHCDVTELEAETLELSLYHSCRTSFKCQGISLP